MRQETLFLILGFHGYVYAQSIESLKVNYSPFCVTDSNGNCQGYTQRNAVVYDDKNPQGRPTSLTLENVSDGELFAVQLNNAPAGTLYGTINGVNVTAPVRVEGGDAVVTTGLSRNFAQTGVPWSLSGDINWFVGGEPIQGATPVRLYAVSQGVPDYFKKYGIYEDFLSFILPQNDGSGRLPQDTTAYNQFVGTKVHRDTKFKYDVFRGAPRYYSNYNRMTTNDNQNQIAGWFALRAWLNDRELIGSDGINGEVNCYDQAGLIQMALSLGRTPVQDINLAYSAPYGYIQKTTLVGNYVTNSPFFRQNPSLQVLPPKDSRRTAFGNHMFCAVGKAPQDIINMSSNQKSPLRIFDSCAGPALGTQTLPQYLAAAVDTNNPRNSKLPTLNQVKIGRGVTQFNNNLRKGLFTDPANQKRQEYTQTQSSTDQADADDFEKRLKALGAESGSDSGKVYRLDFNQIDQTLGGNNQQHNVLSKETHMDADSAIFSYIYRMNNDASQDVRIRMTVAKDYPSAFLSLNHTLSQFDSKLEDTFQAPPANSNAGKNKGSLGSWTLFGKSNANKGSIMFLEGNVLVDLSGLKDSVSLETTAQEIHKFITSPPPEAKNPGQCTVGKASLDNAAADNTIQVGQTVKLSLPVKNAYQSDYTLKTGNALVTYMNQTKGQDSFDVEILGCEEGDDEIVFSFLSPAGEVQDSQPLTIKVVPSQGGSSDGTQQPTGTGYPSQSNSPAQSPSYSALPSTLATYVSGSQPSATGGSDASEQPAQPTDSFPQQTGDAYPTGTQQTQSAQGNGDDSQPTASGASYPVETDQ